MEKINDEKSKEIQDNLDQLIKEKSSEVLFLAISETCVRFGLFKNTERMFLVLFGTFKAFLDKFLGSIENEEKQKNLKKSLEKLSYKLYSDFKD